MKLVRKQPIIVLYFEFENELEFYNLGARSTLFAHGNMIRYDPTLVDMTSNLVVLYTNMKVFI